MSDFFFVCFSIVRFDTRVFFVLFQMETDSIEYEGSHLGVGDFVLLPVITMDTFVENLRIRFVLSGSFRRENYIRLIVVLRRVAFTPTSVKYG